MGNNEIGSQFDEDGNTSELEALRRRYAEYLPKPGVNSSKDPSSDEEQGVSQAAVPSQEPPAVSRKRRVLEDPRTPEDYKPRHQNTFQAQLRAVGAPPDIIALFGNFLPQPSMETNPGDVPKYSPPAPEVLHADISFDDVDRVLEEYHRSRGAQSSQTYGPLLPPVPGNPHSSTTSPPLYNFPQPQIPLPSSPRTPMPLPTLQPGKQLQPAGNGNQPPATPQQSPSKRASTPLPSSSIIHLPGVPATAPGSGSQKKLILPGQPEDPDGMVEQFRQIIDDILNGRTDIED